MPARARCVLALAVLLVLRLNGESSEELSVRWENVEGAPVWVSGEPPEFDFDVRGRHVDGFQLAPGQHTVLHLPANAWVLVVSEDGAWEAHDLEVLWGTGPRLAAPVSLSAGKHPSHRILEPRSWSPSVLRFARPAAEEGYFRFAVFIARHDDGKSLRFYREVETRDPSAPAVRVPGAGWSSGDYQILRAGTKLAVPLSEGRYALVTRLLIPHGERQRLQGYELSVRTDDTERLYTVTRVTERQRPIHYKNALGHGQLAEQRIHIVEIPAGCAGTVIECDSDVALRFHRDVRDCWAHPDPVPEPAVSVESLGVPDFATLQRDVRLGYSAAQEVRQWATLAAQPFEIQRAKSFYSRHSLFRNVLPTRKRDFAEPRILCFATDGLWSPFVDDRQLIEVDPGLYVQRSLVRSDLRSLSVGHFVRVPAQREFAHEYALDPTPQRGVVRLTIPAENAAAGLHIQFDDAEPIRLIDQASGVRGRRRAGLARAALSTLVTDASFGQGSATELQLGFVSGRGPLASTESIELTKPTNARVLRLWNTDGKDRSLRVAVQERGERHFAVSEREFLRFHERIEGAPREMLFWGAYRSWLTTGGDTELVSTWKQWIPTFRLLDRFSDELNQDLIPRAHTHSETGDETGDYLARRKALHAESQGEWLAALEAWSRATRSRDRALRREAELGRLRAWVSLGEYNMAERQALGLIRFHSDRLLREDVRGWLLGLESVDERRRLLVLTAVACASGDPQSWGELARELCMTGYEIDGLRIAASLPRHARPTDAMLGAADRLGWWRTFDRYLAELPRGQRHRWRARAHVEKGELAAAQRELRRAGDDAALGVLLRANSIEKQLRDADVVTRARGILYWEDWWRELPKGRQWTESPVIPVDYEGAVRLRSTRSERQASLYRASPYRPLRVRVLGPTEVQVELRPLHPAGGKQRIDGWVACHVDGGLTPVAVQKNAPARGFAEFNDGARAGTRVTRRITLGPGIHELEIRPQEFSVLARIRVREPAIRWGSLPAFHPVTVRAALVGQTGSWKATDDEYLYDDGHKRTRLPILEHEPSRVRVESVLQELHRKDPRLAARMALRVLPEVNIDGSREWLEVLARTSGEIRAEERALAFERAGLLSRSQLSLPAEDGINRQIPRDILDAKRLSHGVFALYHQTRRAEPFIGSVRTSIEGLLYVASQDDQLREPSLRMAFELSQEKGVSRDLGIAGVRLPRIEWQRLNSPRGGVGERSVEVTGWSPESPRLRARAVVLPELDEGARQVSSGQRLHIDLEPGADTVLRADFRLRTTRYTRPESVQASVAINGGEPRIFPLTGPAGTATAVLPLRSGAHHVEIEIEPPLPGHYLQVRLSERTVDTSDAAEPARPLSSPRRHRNYHLATETQPLRFDFSGPALIRIDELRPDGGSRIEYRSFASGPQSMQLVPPQGEDETGFRVFRADFTTKPRVWPLPPSGELKAKRLDSPRGIDGSPWAIDGWTWRGLPDNGDELGGQEDGTWSARAMFRERRRFDEDPTAATADNSFDRFTELDAIHRFYSERRDVYFESGALMRAHEQGGPTFGAWHRQYHRPDRWPLFLLLESHGYMQWPAAEGMSSAGSSEHSLSVRSKVWQRYRSSARVYHAPSIAFFGRTSSLSDSGDYVFGDVDPDIYSDYRRDHRWGAVVAHAVQCEPVLDHRWVANLSLTTNENLTLDHWRTELGIRQYYRGLILSADYRITGYLNDGDRTRSRTRQKFFMTVAYDHWTSRHQRHEVGARFDHDLSDGESGFSFFYAWNFGRSRGYHDYAPDRISFRRLRDTRIPSALQGREAP